MCALKRGSGCVVARRVASSQIQFGELGSPRVRSRQRRKGKGMRDRTRTVLAGAILSLMSTGRAVAQTKRTASVVKILRAKEGFLPRIANPVVLLGTVMLLFVAAGTPAVAQDELPDTPDVPDAVTGPSSPTQPEVPVPVVVDQ